MPQEVFAGDRDRVEKSMLPIILQLVSFVVRGPASLEFNRLTGPFALWFPPEVSDSHGPFCWSLPLSSSLSITAFHSILIKVNGSLTNTTADLPVALYFCLQHNLQSSRLALPSFPSSCCINPRIYR